MAHYLDHAATTPIRETALDAYVETSRSLANPSSLHGGGRRARSLLDEARESIADALGAHPTEVVFTSGGTEADNLAVKGFYWARSAVNPQVKGVVTSAIEHHAVLDPVRWLGSAQGAEVHEIAVDSQGIIDLEQALSVIHPATAVVSVMWANNEVGSIQPIAQLVEAAQQHGVPAHSDAVQAIATESIDFAASGLDALTLSAHKLGGPVGVGALLLKRNARLTPVLHGGGQERRVRSGTQDVAAAVAFAVAVTETVAERESARVQYREWQQQLVAEVRRLVPGAVLSGPEPGEHRLVSNVNFVFPGAPSESVLFMMDHHQVEVSSGSACTAGVVQSSHVLQAMGFDDRDAASAVRFSFGHTTQADDVTAVVGVMSDAVARARRASGYHG